MNFLLSEPMYYYFIILRNEDSASLISKILNSGIFHIEEKKKVNFEELNILNKKLKTLKKYVKKDDIDKTQKVFSYDQLKEHVERYYEKFERFEAFLERLNQREEQVKYFSSFIELNPDTLNILNIPHLFFLIKKERRKFIIDYIEKYDFLWTEEVLKEYTVFYVLYDDERKKDILKNVIKEIGGVHFDDIFTFSKDDNVFELIEEKKWALLDTKREQTIAFNKLKKELSLIYESLTYSLHFYYKITEFQKSYIDNKYVSYFSGWVPKSNIKKLETILTMYNLEFIKYKEKYGEKEVPVKFTDIGVLQPFDSLVKQYGVTSYGYFNPLLFFTVFFLFFYGFMFADFGHGLIIFLFGILLIFSPNYKKTASLVISLGIFSMAFGLFFGDFFGKENIIKPLLFAPESHFLQIILISIGIGIFVNITGSVLNIIEKIISKEYFKAIFEDWGIVSLIFYLSLLIFPYLAMLKIISNKFMIEIILGIFIIGVILKFIFTKRHYDKEEAITETMLVSTWFIEFLSHSMSFIRVGAFLFAHIALTGASYLIISGINLKGISAILLLVSWTIFVILLEGIVVFIQSLRLNFYEFFSKFFTGDGVLYNPIKL